MNYQTSIATNPALSQPAYNSIMQGFMAPSTSGAGLHNMPGAAQMLTPAQHAQMNAIANGQHDIANTNNAVNFQRSYDPAAAGLLSAQQGAQSNAGFNAANYGLNQQARNFNQSQQLYGLGMRSAGLLDSLMGGV